MEKIKSLRVYVITSDVTEKFYVYDSKNQNLIGKFEKLTEFVKIDKDLYIQFNLLESMEKSETGSTVITYIASLFNSSMHC